jgi:hypothetical protein
MVTVVSVSRTVRQVVDRFVPPSSRPTPAGRPAEVVVPRRRRDTNWLARDGDGDLTN